MTTTVLRASPRFFINITNIKNINIILNITIIIRIIIINVTIIIAQEDINFLEVLIKSDKKHSFELKLGRYLISHHSRHLILMISSHNLTSGKAS